MGCPQGKVVFYTFPPHKPARLLISLLQADEHTLEKFGPVPSSEIQVQPRLDDPFKLRTRDKVLSFDARENATFETTFTCADRLYQLGTETIGRLLA
jgi:hypothetical protein